METEKRLDLISRNDLIKAVEAKRFAISDNTHPYEAIRIQGKYFREVVDNAPKVDAVEVVRCKDCFANGCCSVQDALEMGDEGYCPKGRKENR